MADEQEVVVNQQPSATANHTDQTDNNPSQQETATPIHHEDPAPFPVQNMPPEIQVMVFKEAMRKPSIHFAELALRLLPHKSLWTVILRPMGTALDDSAYQHQEDIESLCSTALQAFQKSIARPITIRLGGSAEDKHIVDGDHDLLCLGRLPKFTEDDNGAPYYSWHPNQTGLSPLLDSSIAQQTFGGLRKIGLVRNIDKDAGRDYYTCRPEAVAWFLDSCPDVTEFYIVLPLRRDYPGIEMIRKWSRTRPKDPSLSVFHGNTKSYVEVHNPYAFDLTDYDPDDIVGARYLLFEKVGCTCPLAPRCSRCPKFGLGLNPKFVFMCLWEIRWHLLREDINSQPTPWKLSRARREGIKFGLLIQDLDF